jgi:hypothetical protein
MSLTETPPPSAEELAAAEQPDTHCYTCDGTGKSPQGWAGNPSADGHTCPDCNGTGIDATAFGTGSDHCPHCATDWKQPHHGGCPAEGIR